MSTQSKREDVGCGVAIAGCLAVLVVAFAIDALLALALVFVLGYFGLHLPFLVAFVIIVLVSAVFGGRSQAVKSNGES